MIRLARASEADLVRAISAAAFVPAYEPIIGGAPRPALEDYAPHIAQGRVWLLEIAASIVAVLVLEQQPEHLLVYSIAVLPAHQRQGHARKLLGFAEERARDLGLAEIRLYTNDKMTRNLALYRGTGFLETGRRAHPTRAGVTLVDLAKKIAP